jgi:hypothetical protein
MKLIGISGRKQSGKSTSGDYLLGFFQTLFPEKTIRQYAFADRLKKDICINILGLSYDQCYGTDDQKNTLTSVFWKEKKLTAREVMEVVGTDIFRSLKVDVWTSSTLSLIKKENPDIAIITDVRFPDEVSSIKQESGFVLRLTRNPFNSNNFIENSLDSNNYNWSNFDYVLDNYNISKEEKENKLNYIFTNFF